jgi:hypothetical protein
LDLGAFRIGFSLEYIKSTRRIKLTDSWIADGKELEVLRLSPAAIVGLMGKQTDYRIKGQAVRVGGARFLVTRTYFIPSLFTERYRTPREPEARSLFDIERIFGRLRTELENQFIRNLVYLGPLRDFPRRYYFATGEVPRDVGPKGENVAELLYYDSKTRRPTSRQTIGALRPWLALFGLADDVRIEALPEGLYSLTLTDPHTRVDVNVSDTGFGTSQVLPIVVECLYSSPGSTILIEQPEIHVHPKVQAELCDVFINASVDKRIVVETHSEHILLRLQRRIAEGTLFPEEVAVYYFEPTAEGTQVRRIMHDGSDSLKEWPPGFFEEDYQESLARSLALARKISNAKA